MKTARLKQQDSTTHLASAVNIMPIICGILQKFIPHFTTFHPSNPKFKTTVVKQIVLHHDTISYHDIREQK